MRIPSQIFSSRRSGILMLVSALFLTSCNLPEIKDRQASWVTKAQQRSQANAQLPTRQTQVANQTQPTPLETPSEVAQQRPDNGFVQLGTGRLTGPARSFTDASNTNGDIKLNFQNTNLLEVVQVILGDMLKANYVLDPGVQGSVSMQTSQPITRDDLLPTLELLLRMNGAALIKDSNNYRIVPLAQAVTGVRAPQLGDSALALPRGYSVQIIPLKYIQAAEMAQILEPIIAGGNQLLRTDSRRNLLILAGSHGDLARLIETIRIFDVDRLAGMSVAMFVPDFVDATTLKSELDPLLLDPERGLMSGLVQLTVIERLNGLMVVTPRPQYLKQVEQWIQRLDRDAGGAGRRLFIYRVQNGKATEIAEILSRLFKPESSEPVLPSAEIAPGLARAEVGNTDAPADGNVPAQPTPPPQPATTSASDGLAINASEAIRIIADEPNNTLLVLATVQEFRQIHAALEQLDVVPLQVLIEATIAEVALSDNLQFGVEWFLRHAAFERNGIFNLDLGAAGIAGIVPGFSYAVQGSADNASAVINLLATESNLSIISSPSLLVLNNQEARIQVGQEVPVSTQQQQSTSTANANIINSVEYRETGVQLTVKPRVNSGGLVTMEVEQEVSNIPEQNNTDPLTPRITQRKIKSTVAVQSGDTIILGGLIRDNRDRSESGIPGLHKVPLFGPLFGAKADNQERTELLILITPRAIADRNSALAATEEFRLKLNSLLPVTNRLESLRAPLKTAPPTPTPKPVVPTEATPQPAPAPLSQLSQPESEVLCERFGPLKANQLADVSQRLSKLGITAQKAPIERLEKRGQRVIILPLASHSEAEKAAQDLAQIGVNDTLIFEAGPSKNGLLIGIFKNPSNAKKRAKQAESLGFSTEIKDFTRKIQENWLAYQRSSDQARAIENWADSIPGSRFERTACVN